MKKHENSNKGYSEGCSESHTVGYSKGYSESTTINSGDGTSTTIGHSHTYGVARVRSTSQQTLLATIKKHYWQILGLIKLGGNDNG